MPSQEEIEQKLRSFILPDLKRGRKDFDKNHTIAVVVKLKEILKHSSFRVDKTVLLIAAYAHDWGYTQLFTQGVSNNLAEVVKHKAEHMKIGAQKLENFLQDPFFNFLSTAQKQRAIHLVAVHDRLDILQDTDELLLLEADTLASLDINLVKPTFDFASNEGYLRSVKQKRVPKFITDYGKKEVKRLFQLRKNYYCIT